MSTVDVISSATIVPMDLPALPGEPDGRRWHFAACLDDQEAVFLGARIMMSPKPDGTFRKVAFIQSESDVGRAVTALAATGPTVYWDVETELVVSLKIGQLVSASEAEVLTGSNLIAVQNAGGGWELLSFCNAFLMASSQYKLTKLLRGRRGTEDQMVGHGIGDRVVVINARVIAGQYDISLHNRSAYFKFVQSEQDEDIAPVQRVSLTSRSMSPFSPCNIVGVRDGSNNLTVTWHRRSRAYFNIFDLDRGAPMLESSELYDVELSAMGADTQSVRVSSPAYTYTATDQAANGITPGDSITISVWQVNTGIDRNGRGVPTGTVL